MNAQVEELLDDPIEIALAERAIELAKSRQLWASNKTLYAPIVVALRQLDIDPRLSTDLDVCFTGDAHKFAAVVRLLRTRGFKCDALPPAKGDTGWIGRYKHPEYALQVWMSFSSSVCKRVKIGTKMVEQDIYEVQCGGDLNETLEAVASHDVA
jgi:hypothetical protein